eukprot:TRINITY_DN435_c0_g3_i1.p1 TRINITY_DN435_c0_g3~~TRINITY_DN435_c0_g3_i1.p1  ORF type:complete len:574 (+),score=113.74 TRINITY_DN435_c0_g3_i1:207-1724(+)
MTATGQRHPFRGDYTVEYDATSNEIRSTNAQLWSNGGHSSDLSFPVLQRALFHLDNAYAFPEVRYEGNVCKTNRFSNTAFRGFGGPQGMMVCETWMAHVAHELGIDAVELREQHLYRKDGVTPYGSPVNVDLRALWDECKGKSDYAKRRADVDDFNRRNRHIKRGITMVPSKFGLSFTHTPLNQGSAVVNVYTDGSVRVSHGGVEMGQGLHTKAVQIAAATLGIDADRIYISDSNTEASPNASPTAASMGSDIYGMAVMKACEKLRVRLEPYVAKCSGDFSAAVEQAYNDRVQLSAQGFFKVPVPGYDFQTGKGAPFLYFTSGIAATEVELDTLTGNFRALRSDVVMDVGNSINPAIDIGQIEGAFVQGQGWSTIEEFSVGDRAHSWGKPGKVLTNGPGAYKIPSSDDIPREFNISLMKGSENPLSVMSSRGIGEPPLFLGASVYFAIHEAIRSARKDAGITSFVQLDSPLSAERIRMACYDDILNDYFDNSLPDYLAWKAKGTF